MWATGCHEELTIVGVAWVGRLWPPRFGLISVLCVLIIYQLILTLLPVVSKDTSRYTRECQTGMEI